MELNQKKWKKVRRQALRRDGHKCKNCGSKSNLHIHHRLQKSIHPGRAYDLSNLTTLCERCHHAHHKKVGYGKKDVKGRRKTYVRRGPEKRTGPIKVVIKKYKAKKYNVKVRR